MSAAGMDESRGPANANADRLYAVAVRVRHYGTLDQASATDGLFSEMRLSSRDREILATACYQPDGSPRPMEQTDRVAMAFQDMYRVGPIVRMSAAEVVERICRNLETSPNPVDADLAREIDLSYRAARRK